MALEQGANHGPHEARRLGGDPRAVVLRGRDVERRLEFLQAGERGIDRCTVCAKDRLTFRAVGPFSRPLDRREGAPERQDPRDRKVTGLEHGAHVCPEAGTLRDPSRIDDEHAELLLEDALLCVPVELVPREFRRIRAVDEQRCAVGGTLEDVDA